MARPKARLHIVKSLFRDGRLTLSGGAAHYLVAVMRVAPGAQVSLFNGDDGEWLGRVTLAGRNQVTVVLERQLRQSEAEPGPWLLFAPLKKDALDTLIGKATELGAERLLPVMTERTVVSRLNRDRLQAQATEAAEQCERLTIPSVADPLPLTALAAHWPQDRMLLVLDEHGSGWPLARVLADLQAQDISASRESGVPLRLALLVGPEGGFAPRDLDALADLPFVRHVTLGPRILRAETAAIAALALCQALAGDGALSPRPWAQQGSD